VGNEKEAKGIGTPKKRRLSKHERRRQLLANALNVIREEGADRLTLGRLALQAGVSKPVVYEHFETRSNLLVELYKMIDFERVDAFKTTMAAGKHNPKDTATLLAEAYIGCAGDMTSEFHTIGAALAGSEDKAVVFQELQDNVVEMFVDVIKPHTDLAGDDLERQCVGLVGAGEALAAHVVKGQSSEAQAIRSLSIFIDTVARYRNGA